MPGPVFLRGDTVTLRPEEREDVEFLQRNANDPRIRHGMTFSEPQSYHAAEQRFEAHAESDDGDTGFLICVDEEPVGMVALFDTDETGGCSEVAYWVTPAHQGNGYGREAVDLAVGYAFDERRFHRVHARVLATNEASQALLESVGFTREGTMREHLYVDGDYRDVHRYGLLAREH